MRGSPRHGVYLVADELFRNVPSLMQHERERFEESSTVKRWMQWLPEHHPHELEFSKNWKMLAHDVARNYRMYLEGTQS